MKILIVDDEREALIALQRLLKRKNFTDVDICDNGTEAIEFLNNNNYDIVLLDLLMPDIEGMQVLEKTKPANPLTEYIILTAVDEIQSAVKAVQFGAYDYLVKPAEPERIFLTIQRAFERKGLITGMNAGSAKVEETIIPDAFKKIITNSSRMKEAIHYTNIMAQIGNPILITGESGTGKELLARGIHEASMDKNAPFIAVNVASVPDSLFESQFFGHKKGSFTGATQDYKGYFEQANGGTLFLDEIGELPLNQQVKFLRVLEEQSITPIGSSEKINFNVRIISATNVDIDIACQEGKFRLDLLYRLKSAFVHLPSLNERGEDIKLLAEHFLRIFSEKHNKKKLKFSTESVALLSQKKYKGNVRELAQLVENGVVLAQNNVVKPSLLGFNKTESEIGTKILSLKENAQKHIKFVLETVEGDKKRAADILGISLRQLQRKIAELKK